MKRRIELSSISFYIWTLLIVAACCWAFLQWNHPLAARARANLEGVINQPLNWHVLSDWYNRYMDSVPVLAPNRVENGEEPVRPVASAQRVTFVAPLQGRVLLPYDESRQGLIFQLVAGERQSAEVAQIKCAADGRVIFSGEVPGLGTTVVVQHAGDYQTWYGLLASTTRKVNERLVSGQSIGTVATTADKRKLAYFAVKEGTRFVDPQSLVDFQ